MARIVRHGASDGASKGRRGCTAPALETSPRLAPPRPEPPLPDPLAQEGDDLVERRRVAVGRVDAQAWQTEVEVVRAVVERARGDRLVGEVVVVVRVAIAARDALARAAQR